MNVLRFRNLILFIGIASVLLFAIGQACGPVGFSIKPKILCSDCEGPPPPTPCDDCGPTPSPTPEPGGIRNISVTQNVNPESSDEPIDILIIDDNSASMSEEQASMADAFPSLIGKPGVPGKLDGRDWQIGITSTSTDNTKITFGNTPGYNGLLYKFRTKFDDNSTETNHFILDPSIPNASDLFANTIKRKTRADCYNNADPGEPCSRMEQGVKAAQLAIQKNNDAVYGTKPLIRTVPGKNGKLVLIILSDENECSSGLGKCPADSIDLDKPEKLVELFKTKYPNKKLIEHSIVKPSKSECPLALSTGTVYLDLVNVVNNIFGLGSASFGKICDTNYTAQIQDLGETIISQTISAELECAPINNDVSVSFDPLLTDPATVTVNEDMLAIKFKPKVPTKVSYFYQCPELIQ